MTKESLRRCLHSLKPSNVPICNTFGLGNVSRARRSGRHARVPFTSTQANALETAYGRAPYLAPPALRALAATLQLREDRIKIWFQNRRARDRREKAGSITSPQAINLPSTAIIQKYDSNETWSAVLQSQGKHFFEKQKENSVSLENKADNSEMNAWRLVSPEDILNIRSESPLDVETLD